MKIVSSEEMRRIESLGIQSPQDEVRMILAAGKAAAEAILDWLPKLPPSQARSICALAGTGKNGADTRVCAAWLRASGKQVDIHLPLGEPAPGPAAEAVRQCEALLPGMTETQPLPSAFPDDALLLDGLLGTGLKPPPRLPAAALIRRINDANLPVVSIDIPSGLQSDTGEGTDIVQARLTVTMGFPKKGMFLAKGPNCVGELRVVPFGLEKELMGMAHGEDAFGLQDARALLRPRPRVCHKNNFGRILLLAGSRQYPGAAVLAARGALRAGAGVTVLCTPAEIPCGMQLPAALIPCRQQPPLEQFDAILCGPGTAPEDAMGYLASLSRLSCPVVLDATALRCIAEYPQVVLNSETPMILTPHPGEMRAMLESMAPGHLQATRTEQALALAMATGAVVVLKGCHTVVAAPDGRHSINLSGGPALATPGTGDVLAGILTTLAAQMPLYEAARLGVYLHGLAADLFHGAPQGLIADDIPELLPRAFAQIC